jgi:ParB-like chromosome segregation protein Spo0J
MMDTPPPRRLQHEIRTIPLAQISERPGFNIRFQETDIPTLAACIAEWGLLFPPLVVPVVPEEAIRQEPGSSPHFFVVHGHRRLAALRHLQWESAPFFVAHGLSMIEQELLNIAENGREDLTPAELAERCANMVGLYGKKQGIDANTVAQRTGYSVSYIQNLIRLRNKLHPDLWAMMIRTGRKAPVSALLQVVAKPPEEQLIAWKAYSSFGKVEESELTPPPRLTWQDRAAHYIEQASERETAEFIRGAKWLRAQMASKTPITSRPESEPTALGAREAERTGERRARRRPSR